MSETGLLDVLATFKKFNPVAFILMVAVCSLFLQMLTSNTPLPEKLLFLTISGTMYVIAAFFEFWIM